MDRSKIPPSQSPGDFKFPEFQRFNLDNGLQVLFARHSKLPLISMELVVHSGANFDAPGDEGLASFVAEMLPEGTKSRNSFAISSGFDNLGTQFNSHAGWNASYLEMQMVKKQLGTSMELFCDVLFNPVFAEDEIDRMRKQLINRRVRVRDNAGSLASEKFNSVLFQGSRYAEPIIGRISQLNNISQQKCIQFFKKIYTPRNSTLIIVGDLDFDDTCKLAEKYFGQWSDRATVAIEEPGFAAAEKRKVYLVHKPNAQQAEIRAGHLGIDRHDPDYYRCSVLNQIFGGYFLSRLNQNLREDKGFTYGAHSRFVMRKAKGPFQISSAIETQYIFDAVHEILKELEEICQGSVSEEELGQAKGYMTGIFPIAFESSTQIAAGLSTLVEYDLPDDYFRTYKDHILAVTEQQVYKAAQKYLHPDQLSIVICTDKKEIEEKFKSAYEVEVSEVPQG